MDNYQHILYVANCNKEDEAELIQQARNLALQSSTRLSLLYVVPQIPAYYLQCPASLELEKQLKLKAQKRLAKLKANFESHEVNVYLRIGDMERAIEELAEQLQVDLVVMAENNEPGLLQKLLEKILKRKSHIKHKIVYVHSICA
jgi:nucleotide-binding universal stress UspA family protein